MKTKLIWGLAVKLDLILTHKNPNPLFYLNVGDQEDQRTGFRYFYSFLVHWVKHRLIRALIGKME